MREVACSSLQARRYYADHTSRLRHLFATRCIEAGVDIPTVSRWLGHVDGGALAMRTYGHLRREHSAAMAQRVTFESIAASNVLPIINTAHEGSAGAGCRRIQNPLSGARTGLEPSLRRARTCMRGVSKASTTII